ncbi:MAG: LPS assembly protein LptD [Proteobacteria bacterium]|nr:LPS assembly protein LptD [Pseudomonadota bacterium]
MHPKYLIIAGALLALSHVRAAETDACKTSLDPLSMDALLTATPTTNDGTIEFQVGELEAQFGIDPSAKMTGGVLLRSGTRMAGADEARYVPSNRSLLLEGNVRYEDQGTQIESDLAEFAYDMGSVRFEGADFSLSGDGRGTASVFEINQQGLLQLDGVSYTTCPPGSNDWLIEAKDIDVDTNAGVATARGMKLRFQGVPILYAPYLSFPIGDARKSGVLTPDLGSTSRSGEEISLPFYLNLAPNYDATITPHFMSDRGLQLQTEFRYLTESSHGEAVADYLDNDDTFHDSRYLLGLQHMTQFGGGWRNQLDFRQVSDSQYFEDMGGSLSSASITHLDRTLNFEMYTDNLAFFGQLQDFQTIDDAITPEDEPYRRLPQLLARGLWPDQWLGLELGFLGEIVNFDRDVGVTGWRMNLAPEVALPITGPGWFVTPGVRLDYTSYKLSDTEPGASDDPSRTLPIATFDVGMILERALKNSALVQTIEPRILFAHVPFREQSDLPVFDTITPDLHLVQLYRANRYLGVDRIADTDQVSIGVTSRVFDVSTGRDLVAATIGQIRYLSSSGVTLPGGVASESESSDYIAKLSFLLNKNINFDVGHQWGASSDGTTQSEARIQYAPSMNKVLNLAYRFRRDSLEQGDLSLSWPLGSRWNFVGRYNYSLRDDEALERFFGLEYESCCWGLRLVSRRHISSRDGTQESSISLQLILKGMASVGTSADKILERGILGYSADIR